MNEQVPFSDPTLLMEVVGAWGLVWVGEVVVDTGKEVKKPLRESEGL